MNDKIEELREKVENARKAFEEHPSIRTGSRYGDALNELSEALNEQQKREPQEPVWLDANGNPI